MKTSIALALGFYSALAQSMCYIVENGAGQTVYVSERPPVSMAADSPSKEIQARYPDGHMLIIPECPLTSNQQEARRLQAISEVKIAREIREMQAQASATESSYFPAETPQPAFYAETLSQGGTGHDDYAYYGGYGYYGGAYYRPIRGHNRHGPHVSHYARWGLPVQIESGTPRFSLPHRPHPISWQQPPARDYQSVRSTVIPFK